MRQLIPTDRMLGNHQAPFDSTSLLPRRNVAEPLAATQRGIPGRRARHRLALFSSRPRICSPSRDRAVADVDVGDVGRTCERRVVDRAEIGNRQRLIVGAAVTHPFPVRRDVRRASTVRNSVVAKWRRELPHFVHGNGQCETPAAFIAVAPRQQRRSVGAAVEDVRL